MSVSSQTPPAATAATALSWLTGLPAAMMALVPKWMLTLLVIVALLWGVDAYGGSHPLARIVSAATDRAVTLLSPGGSAQLPASGSITSSQSATLDLAAQMSVLNHSVANISVRLDKLEARLNPQPQAAIKKPPAVP